MIDVCEYIKMIMKKKNITNTELCKRLNKIEEKLGESRTAKQNISNYLHRQWIFRPKILVKYDNALGLPMGTLVNMVEQSITKEAKKELSDLMKKVGDIK